MPWTELTALLLLGGAGWLWIDSLRAREACLRVVRRACAARSLQLLDDTVAVGRMRLARNDDGQLQLQREFVFEYSDTGDNRRRGGARFIGHELIALSLEHELTSVSDFPLH